MLEYMDDGLDVLSDSLVVQHERVMAGGYALVSDLSSTSILLSRDCQLTIADDRFRGMIYPAFLQKNSAYTDMVNDVWEMEFFLFISLCTLKLVNAFV